jgi:hypothetical protein
VTVNGRLVVAFSEVGLAAAVAGLGLISMTVGAAARKEISEGLLVRVLADWEWARSSCSPSFRRAKLQSHPRVHSSTCLLQVPS